MFKESGKSIGQIAGIQILFLLGVWGFWALDSAQKSTSLAYGSVIAFVNLLIIWLVWAALLSKKNVATALILVVFKYSILIILLAFFGHKIENKFFFVIGIISVPIAITFFGVLRALKLRKKV